MSENKELSLRVLGTRVDDVEFLLDGLAVEKGDQTAPPQPTSSNITHNSITITAESGSKIRYEGNSYDSPYTFSDLDDDTKYSFYAFKPETGTLKKSPNSLALRVSTLSLDDDKTGSPGPKRLIAGDMEAGYFGIVQANQFFTGSQLASKVGLTEGMHHNNEIGWLKFAYKGNIQFRPMKSIRKAISWNDLDSLGLVSGTKLVTKDGIDYKVRLMSGATEDPADPITDASVVHGSEWNKLLYPLHENARSGNWEEPKYVEDNIPDWGIGFTNHDFGQLTEGDTSYPDGLIAYCQEELVDVDNELEGEKVILIRGSTDISVVKGQGAEFDENMSNPDLGWGDMQGWHPVLEVTNSKF